MGKGLLIEYNKKEGYCYDYKDGTFLSSLASLKVISRCSSKWWWNVLIQVYARYVNFWSIVVEESCSISRGIISLLVDLGQKPVVLSQFPVSIHSHHPLYFRGGANSLVIAEKRVLVLTNLDGRTTKLRNQNLVTGLDGRSNALSIAVKGTGANSENLCFVEFLDGGLGKEDATGGLGLSLDALDENAVKEGCEGLDGLGGDGGLGEC